MVDDENEASIATLLEVTMPAKLLLFFMLGWLLMCAAAGYSVGGLSGVPYGAGAGLVLTIPMIMGAGIRGGLRR